MATNYPDFFIIGAAKAGTTALHEFLDIHPQVYMSAIKEPNFFSNSEIQAQGLYYKTNNVSERNAYRNLWTNAAPSQLKGESSVSYIYYQNTATNIHNAVPNAKIIAILRDPVDRAVSHYNMDRNLGLVKADMQSIFRDPEKFSLHYQQYFLLGNYFEQLERYYNTFTSTQIHICFYDQLKTQEETLINDLCTFLEIDPHLANEKIERTNITSSPKNKLLKDLYSSQKIRTAVKTVIPEGVRKLIQDKLFEKNSVSEIDPDFKSTLKNYFSKDIVKLESLLNKDLRTWLN
ncbi:MAG: hypothetical protein HKN22_07905 [Bacteroidia bacterium]|nr:hypothetical protein [Bacteroidia bacterium]